MRKNRWCSLVFIISVITACDLAVPDVLPQTVEVFLSLPDLPASWFSVLGSPAWHIEWPVADGSVRRVDLPAGSYTIPVALSLRHPTPICAYPFWPQLGIDPKRTKPAGALFPLDLKDRVCRLTWLGGVEAVFYQFLGSSTGDPRYGPECFNWRRFRALFDEATVPAPVLADPWCVDWSLVAEKTRKGGFDSRRLVPRETKGLAVSFPVPGPWVSGSPFCLGSPSEGLSFFTVQASMAVDTFLSTHGIIVYTWDGMVYIPGEVDR